ncbi:DUF554 domain-containing protein [Haloplasma contractile]|uniref:Membrane protein putative n=1 Tax=Haloplasma contractile SSD-17B TaxID=1033810 RepID=U2FGT1_9MOLU|nr:DUF554 domain-containing protein [Haloplasma contractile]ERJ12060.1 Membrane protein putative [Haloplasma contractile SSD-17B]
MIGIGTLVNAVVIIIGSLVGLLFQRGLKERYKEIIMQAIALAVMVLGLKGVLEGLMNTEDGAMLETLIIMIGSLAIGSLLGEWANIDLRLNKMANYIEKKIGKVGNFAEGFVKASLVYCVGAMAIVGALEDGLQQNPSILITKSVLDGITAIIFTSTLGIGVLFSFIPVLIYQGSITLLAGILEDFLTYTVIEQMSIVGNILIFAIGITLLEIKSIKLSNMLPAIFMPFIYYLIKLLIF